MTRIKRIKRTYYEGELDNIDPVELGAKYFHEGIELNWKLDPTTNFHLKNDIDYEKNSAFFFSFASNMEKGWFRERNIEDHKIYKESLPDFKDTIPEVGSIVYVEHATNKGTYFRCRIEFIPEERDNVVIRYLDSNMMFGQTKIAVVGYQKRGVFVKFHTTVPIQKSN